MAKETSCTLLFLMELLWLGHRTLVPGPSEKVLEIIQYEDAVRLKKDLERAQLQITDVELSALLKELKDLYLQKMFLGRSCKWLPDE